VPEGPSIVILREQVAGFARRRILGATGNTKIDKERLIGERVIAFRSWGKHFLIELAGFSLRVHFLLFGTYRINERKDAPPRLRLQFRNGEINFYACSVKYVEGELEEAYDWTADVMSDRWDASKARQKLRAMPDTLVCDALLDQNVFAGVGNIIKNEVLFRIRVHPLATVGSLPAPKLRQLVEQARTYSFEFLEWKKAFVLKKHWLAHNKRICPRCDVRLTYGKLGRTNRRSFYCEQCQVRYGARATKKTTARRRDPSPVHRGRVER
jgi:endonuclease VIII